MAASNDVFLSTVIVPRQLLAAATQPFVYQVFHLILRKNGYKELFFKAVQRNGISRMTARYLFNFLSGGFDKGYIIRRLGPGESFDIPKN